MSTITADGDLDSTFQRKGKKAQLRVGGTWGNGTITFYIERFDEDDGFSAEENLYVYANTDGIYEITLEEDARINPKLAGATSPSLDYDWI